MIKTCQVSTPALELFQCKKLHIPTEKNRHYSYLYKLITINTLKLQFLSCRDDICTHLARQTADCQHICLSSSQQDTLSSAPGLAAAVSDCRRRRSDGVSRPDLYTCVSSCVDCANEKQSASLSKNKCQMTVCKTEKKDQVCVCVCAWISVCA